MGGKPRRYRCWYCEQDIRYPAVFETVKDDSGQRRVAHVMCAEQGREVTARPTQPRRNIP